MATGERRQSFFLIVEDSAISTFLPPLLSPPPVYNTVFLKLKSQQVSLLEFLDSFHLQVLHSALKPVKAFGNLSKLGDLSKLCVHRATVGLGPEGRSG